MEYINIPAYLVRFILTDKRAGSTRKVIGIYVLASYGWQKESIDQSDIVHSVGVSRSTVANALKYYVRRGLLWRGEDYRFRIRHEIMSLLGGSILW